jgi:predicted ATPase
MITKLRIEHYKSIQSLELALRQVNIFVGPNGAGKSNIIDGIQFVRDALRYGLDAAITERHGLNSIRQWAPTRPYHIRIVLEIGSKADARVGTGLFAFTLASRRDEYLIL